MRTLEQLINSNDPGWPVIEEWLANATNHVEVLSVDRQSGDEVLVQLQVTTRSILGAVAHSSGGILFDHGWLRVLGSGHNRLQRTLVSWNGLTSPRSEHRNPGAILVADDAIGGFFAMNGDAFDAPTGHILYFAPDTLEWEDLGFGYSDFVVWACSGDLALFYQRVRWPRWEQEIAELSGEHGISIYPYLWLEGPEIGERSRRAVPIDELWGLQMYIRDELGRDVI